MISLLAFSLVFISSEREKMMKDIVKNGEIFASFSSKAIYDNFVQYYTHPRVEDFENFKINVTSILANNKDVVGVELLGVNGRILFDSEEFISGKYEGPNRVITDKKTIEILNKNKTSYRNIIENDEDAVEIMVPLDQAGGSIFVMRYILSNASMKDRMIEIYGQIASVVFPLLIFAIITAVFFTLRLVRPIKKLTNIVEKIRAGNFDIKAEIKSKDEIGRLAFAFNDMTSKLKESYGVLEAKVKERTAELDKKVEELAENNAELSDSKRAITNLLEDIEQEKEKIEETVKIRTKELSDEKSRLLASINSLSFGFIISDMNNNILLSNPRVSEILEKEGKFEKVEDISKIFEGFDLTNSCKECLKNQKVVEIKEVLFYKKFLRIFCAPILNQSIPIGHVIIIEDITEAKVIERSKDEFFAVASHELRTPLTAIHGNSDMILSMYMDQITNQDLKDMLTDINSASVRLINIVNDFLEVSRLEQGKVETKKEVFDINEIINKVIKDLKVVADRKSISVSYNPPVVDLPKAFGDKGHTEQVLINIIGNAIKFTDNGSVIVTVSPEKNFLKIRVEDTGIGIEPKNQTLLFRKFQQAGDKVLARKDSNSTGLGLYISKLLVSNMGGSISLEKSDTNKGSIFAFTLPIAL